MTISAVKVFEPVEAFTRNSERNSPKPPPRTWQASDPPFKGYTPAPSDGYRESSPSTAIVIDNGKNLHSALNLNAESFTRLELSPCRLVIRQTATDHYTYERGQVQGQEAQSDLHVRRVRLLCRRHNKRTDPECF